MGSDDPTGLFKKEDDMSTEKQRAIWRENYRKRRDKMPTRICPECGIRELDKYQKMCSECCYLKEQMRVAIYQSTDSFKENQKIKMRTYWPNYLKKNPEKRKKYLEKQKIKYATDKRLREDRLKKMKERYANDPEYREKIRTRSKNRYYRLKNEKNSNAADE